MPKDFKTIDEQLEILRDRGLRITDDAVAKDFLLKNNYYRVSGYSLTLRDHDVFYPSATFQNIIDIYSFDHELRNLLLWAIEIIEVNFKSKYAYFFTRRYGGLGYFDSNHFVSFEEYAKVFGKAESQKKRSHRNEAYLKHYIDELKEPIPFWAYVDLLTIADISILYSISEDDLRREIAKEYGLTHVNATEVMGNFIHGMTIVRNLCAHGSRIFNRFFITKPTLNKKELSLLRKDASGNPDNQKLFGYILNMRRMLATLEFTQFKQKLVELCNKYPFVDMKHYGFANNWQEIL